MAKKMRKSKSKSRSRSRSASKKTKRVRRSGSKKAKRAKRSASKKSDYQKFINKKNFAAKKAAMGGNPKAPAVLKALAADWKKGVRSY
jgi:hypothetical protein